MTVQVDVVIVGGGVIGVSAAYALCQEQKALHVLLLEARTIANASSSSAGDSRMFRCMYSREYFGRMKLAALRDWQLLEEAAGVGLLKRHGLLFYGDVETGETVQGSVPDAHRTMQRMGIPHEYLHAEQLNCRWPMRAKQGCEGVYEPGAGSVHANQAISAMARLAQQRGLEIREGEEVASIRRLQSGKMRVRTKKGSVIHAAKVVVAAGPWTNELLRPLGVQLDLEIWAVHWGHAWVDPGRREQYPQWYSFGRERPATWDGGLYYGFPPDSTEPVAKVGCDFAPDCRQFRVKSMADFHWEPDPVIVSFLEAFLRDNWLGLDSGLRDVRVSPYTMTRDGFFVLDRIPGMPEVSVFAGGSGRAFKFAPLLGRCLADLTLDRRPCFDVSPLRMQRSSVWLESNAQP
ncbi:hypothetical protein WJX74_002337 [Apatococcus lobatus]|uniref:FAD dependent oxidoreductase domain-containing protein n=1 Tax=Apatococcus lobatus TaxID=904363 RepID=A0AAW1QM49_9CHLO